MNEMDISTFWTRFPVRAVVFLLVAAFAGLSFRLVVPAKPQMPIQTQESAPRVSAENPPQPWVDLRSIDLPPEDPFQSVFLGEWVERTKQEAAERKRRLEDERRRKQEEKKQAASRASERRPESDQVTKKPQEPPRRIKLRYRGLIRRVDGREAALIETSDGNAYYVSSGGLVDRLTVESIDRSSVRLRGPDGTLWHLQRGDVLQLKEAADGTIQ